MQDIYGNRDENIIRAASGLHGGIGGMNDVCGALLGASIMVGLMCCKTGEASNPEKKELATQTVGSLYKWFEKEFGTVKCRDITVRFRKEINEDINTRDLAEPEKVAEVFKKCDDLAGRTSAGTVEMLWDILEAEKE